MEQKLTIKDKDQEIRFSGLDRENELRIIMKDMNGNKTTIWVCLENIISIKKYIDNLTFKFLNEDISKVEPSKAG